MGALPWGETITQAIIQPLLLLKCLLDAVLRVKYSFAQSGPRLCITCKNSS